MRLFIGIPLPKEIRQAVYGTMNRETNRAIMRLTPRDNYHITVAFLGEQPADRIPGIQAAMKQIAESSSQESLRCAGLRTFPAHTAPRCIVTPVTDGKDAVIAMMCSVKRLLQVPMRTRGVTPHVTLARMRRGARVDTAELRRRVSPQLHISYVLSEIVLYRSYLEQKGARYEPLWTIRLRT